MDFSVIICTYNREKYILQSIQSFADQTFDKALYEIVIVNNNSTDTTNEICTKFVEDHKNINIKYVIEKNQGLSWARNRGIEESEGDVLVFIDDDAFAHKGYLKALSDYYKTDEPADAFGGKIYPQYESSKPKWMSSFLITLMSVIDLGDNIQEFSANKFPIGANMGFKAEVFKKHGVFDVNLGRKGKNMMGGEEKDLYLRIKKGKSKVVYLPDVWVYHIIPDSRLTKEFIKTQAIGVGCSYRQMYYPSGFSGKMKLFISESVKWAGTFIISLGNVFILQFAKAKMLIKFRSWVLKGIRTKELK